MACLVTERNEALVDESMARDQRRGWAGRRSANPGRAPVHGQDDFLLVAAGNFALMKAGRRGARRFLHLGLAAVYHRFAVKPETLAERFIVVPARMLDSEASKLR